MQEEHFAGLARNLTRDFRASMKGQISNSRAGNVRGNLVGNSAFSHSCHDARGHHRGDPRYLTENRYAGRGNDWGFSRLCAVWKTIGSTQI
jgi:hypothetical protein